ncbi:MAG: glutathione S-transferase family protein [Bermanella sp.]
MAVITPTNKEVTSFKGLHLYHHGLSQCSQRVRICLEEKGVPWKSQYLDLMNGEHLTEYYRGINPNNVVPTLVHDGKVIIESTDIIEYIDQNFPGASFTPENQQERETMEMWLKTSNTTKSAIKVLSHEFLFKAKAQKSPKQIAQMKANIHNQELIKFSEEFSSKQGLSRDKIIQSIKDFQNAFEKMDNHLAKHTWLAGETFSLADISWMGDVHRMMLMNFPLEKYVHLQSWIKRVQARPSFQKALVAYEPKVIKYFFKAYSLIRRLKGTSVAQFAKAA